MDVQDGPLLFQTSWAGEDEEQDEEEEDEEDGVTHAAGRSVWRAVGWLYAQPWASGGILGVAVLLPCTLFAYMLIYCPPLDIDLSYSAFEVHTHFSAERFDALTIAVKSQLGSWDRRRRDLHSEVLCELLLEKLGHANRTSENSTVTCQTEAPQWRSRDEAMEMEESVKHNDTKHKNGEILRRRRFAPNYYLQSQAIWRIELVFVAQGDGDSNIFTPERLQTIHHVERLLMQHPQFQQFCWKPMEVLRDLPLGPSYCSPPSSLLTYLYPSERGGKIYYDGMGPDLADIQGSLRLAITHPQFYWYVDESLSPERLSSSLLRSEIHFGAPLPSYYSLQDRGDEQRTRFKNFVVQYADILAKQSTRQVKVLYGGTELFDDEVRHTFHNDVMLAFISGVCIALLVFVLTSFSVFLTVFGLASIGLSCLMALFLYHVVFGVRYLGILNGVAAFVIIGIGVDDVFVFISTFRQASDLLPLSQRIVYTMKTAGRATFITSFTTAAAYAANTFSQIPAVHDFGLFMALIVSCCWLCVFVLMPAALCIWTQRVEPREHAWLNCCLSVPGWKLFSGLSVSHSPLSDEDDDVALLSVEMEPGSCDTDGDAAILSLSVETPSSPAGRRHVGVVSTKLQWALKRLVAEPAVEHRKAVLGVFLLVLLVSAGCCCLLRPATNAPLLFRRDTNLQTLLALRSNLSGQGISCPMCSGVFMEKPKPLYGRASAFKVSARQQSSRKTSGTNQTDVLLTVCVSKMESGAASTVYRFTLNTSTPAAPQPSGTQHDEVSFFQAYNESHGNYTRRMTACVSRVYRPDTSWMLTSGSCDHRHGWTPEFSFYVSPSPQQHSRKLFFAQHRLRPHSTRVCTRSSGCGVTSVPDGPTKGTFYVPLPSVSSSEDKKISKTSGFNPCSGGVCGQPAVRPLVDTGAMVFVVFGILGVNRSEQRDNHVIGDVGKVILDPEFDIFQEMEHLCRICKAISANKQLVKPGGAQCLPSGNKLSSVLPLLHPECHSLPVPNLLPGQLSHGAVGTQAGKVRWLSMAFESTTYKGKSSFQTYSDFLQWETFVQELLSSLPRSSALRRGFQTCEHWKQIFMEIIGVESALWSLLLSLAICVAAVSVFTAHLFLLLPVLITILGVICLVVALMYWLGWELGAVEAISLSILVGSSVDYCLHLVEGYMLAGAKASSASGLDSEPAAERQRRTVEAVHHVGVAIVSSALTTVISTVPLFFCVIVPFAKFGQIVAINTAVSILFTLTVTVASLAVMAPARFSRPPSAVLKAILAVAPAAAAGAALCWAGGQLGTSAWQSFSQ
ncbi:protein dispatched homolog 3 isoform X1 [Synchiropus splendidus]|uniref:protein dispatched homolog 3 isoform X1 n=1 Tax=Synchiropus splendidus TaxID=270530 RepID=UPI00237E2843|nr:protein dispatched homolog 3 isoform X1 [Synchiropus splendidus]XP_053726241.1 protein dispatched homolog 3 isoform X1 [Synchiropus splendidus]XP_053726242.1 protein dispatched homolog 3 isoform X1 [Synchiropus splendidus]XP_053726243.1 protein dispatched homolog 3 isoform X1 [Synchiropus splendidus]XP_053726244.1 protein dispatched homolog 3 isoform X1 [Synchiropus splendidus]XP_053726245.1 protein dispatched homolog 3 isoform X1 [Synchiropus splendidus]